MSNAYTMLPEKSLTKEQESAIAVRILKTRREEDINELVMSNMREAVVYTRHCSRESIPDDELISICYSALVRSAKHFNPKYGMRFFGFAKPALRGDVVAHYKAQETVRGANEHADPDVVDGQPIEVEIVNPEFSSIFARDHFKIVSEVIERKLTAQEKMVIDLAYQQHLNFQDIGKLLGVSRSAIQAAHARSIRKIRNELARQKKIQD